MFLKAKIIILLFLTLVVLINCAAIPKKENIQNLRLKRQIDLTLSAEHDDKEDETDIALEAIANLWRSSDGNTQIDGSAKVLHHSNSLQNGNTKYSARFHLHHDYRKRK